MAKMAATEMIAHLMGMGLKQQDREKVLATHRDAGQVEALEQTKECAARSAAQMAGAKSAARYLFGIIL